MSIWLVSTVLHPHQSNCSLSLSSTKLVPTKNTNPSCISTSPCSPVPQLAPSTFLNLISPRHCMLPPILSPNYPQDKGHYLLWLAQARKHWSVNVLIRYLISNTEDNHWTHLAPSPLEKRTALVLVSSILSRGGSLWNFKELLMKPWDVYPTAKLG